ncbi:MAG: LytR C-terminal domain-containing protein [Georgenia sp.]
MSTQNEDYPEDEFDRAGRDRTPQGVHRAPRSIWRTLLPVIAIVALAPLLAWGAISLLGNTGATPDPGAAPPSAAPAQTPTGAATDPGTTGPATDPGTAETPAEPTPEETPATPVDFTAGIAVLNGAGVDGLAGDVVGRLASAGFAGGTAADYRSAEPTTTTLYYNNADLTATAEAIGAALGITNLVESASATSTTDVAIVLRSDYAR